MTSLQQAVEDSDRLGIGPGLANDIIRASLGPIDLEADPEAGTRADRVRIEDVGEARAVVSGYGERVTLDLDDLGIDNPTAGKSVEEITNENPADVDDVMTGAFPLRSTPAVVSGLDAKELASIPDAASNKTFVGGGSEGTSLTVYQTADREKGESLGSIKFEGSPQDVPIGQVVERLQSLSASDIRDRLESGELFEAAPEVREREADREARRATREAARDAAEAAGVDLNEFGIDARADGTLIIQDRESNRTETIEPGEDADSFNPDTFDPSSSGTESPSPAPESNGTGATLPDMSGLNRPRVIAAILGVIALIYGATQ